MSKRKLLAGLVLVLVVLACCRGPKALYVRDLSFLYAGKSEFYLNTGLYKSSQDHYELFFEIYSPDGTKMNWTEVGAELFVHDQTEQKNLLYTDSLPVKIDGRGIGKIEFSMPEIESAVFELSVITPAGAIATFLGMNNNNPYSAGNFLLLDTADAVVCRKYFGSATDLKVLYNNSRLEKLWIYYFSRDFLIAQPPFTYAKREAFNYIPDSIFSVELKNGRSGQFRIDRPGFYHVLADTSQRQGITVFLFPKGFPEISTAAQMLEPLRYITSQKEFDVLKEEQNTKRAVERFWLKLKGDEVRALNAIRSYYSAAEKANIYFSSYLEGWKTDRGLIYMIYGPPHKVNRGNGFETWLYGQANSVNSVEFTFVQVINPFTDNDYQLIKSPKYKSSWYYAVDNVRR
ncbi:MAG: GWxTD domain-containing protein [Bacteroidota bacterium]|nr:GWxTD domain-containing protein [Bacteroidota bacterium]